MGKGERPEHMAPPEIFYNDDEARKYTTNRCVGRVPDAQKQNLAGLRSFGVVLGPRGRSGSGSRQGIAARPMRYPAAGRQAAEATVVLLLPSRPADARLQDSSHTHIAVVCVSSPPTPVEAAGAASSR